MEVAPAHVSDVHALLPALESTKDRGLFPEEVLADSLYGSDENIKKAGKMGVEVVSPVMGTPKVEVFGVADFPQTDKGKIASCPRGHAPVKIKQDHKTTMSVGFDSAHCNACPDLTRCPVKAGKKRHYLRIAIKALRIAARRAREQTVEFKDKYRWRAGIESTFSGMDKLTGIKHLRVRGLAAVGYCARMKAIGINLLRAARVKRAIDALLGAPGTLACAIRTIILDVKERFLSPWRRIRHIFKSTTQNGAYCTHVAA